MKNKPFYLQPTPEVYQPVSLRYVLLNILTPLLFFILLNQSMNYFLAHHTINTAHIVVQKKWQLLEELEEPVDWIIIGDSACNQGIIPEKFIDELGENGTALNLCTIGPITMASDAWLINTYIDRFGAPKNILKVHSVQAWQEEGMLFYLAIVPHLWRYKLFGPPKTPINFMTDIEILRYQLLPIDTQFTTLKESIHLYLTQEYDIYQKPYFDRYGYMPYYTANPDWVEEQYQERIHTYQEPFHVTDINKQSIEYLIKLAEEYHINLYIVDAPIYEKFYENKGFQSHHKQVQDWLADLTKSSDYTHHLPLKASFPKDQMEDSSHVIYESAIVYTQQVAKAINEHRKNKE